MQKSLFEIKTNNSRPALNVDPGCGTRSGIGSHHSASSGNDEWLTPPEIIKALGIFDLDPCSPICRPWDTALHHLNVNDDGLSCDWFGRVWCNPPYGLEATRWLNKLASHGNGIALIFARTETKMFFQEVWPKASGILFIEGRLFFYRVNGEKAKSNSGAPSVLVAYGEDNSETLKRSKIKGQFVGLSC